MEVLRGAYGSSLAAVRADADGTVLAAWLAERTRLDRDAAHALLAWLGQDEPVEWPRDGRGMARLGFCAALATRGTRGEVVLASARRARVLAGGSPRRGRGRGRPDVLAWRDGAREALGGEDVSALVSDLDHALAEVEIEERLSGWPGRLPRAHLRALRDAEPWRAIEALRARGPATADAVRRRAEADDVVEKFRTPESRDVGEDGVLLAGHPRPP